MGICLETFTDEQQASTWWVLLAASIFSLFGSSYILVNFFFHSEKKNPLIQLVVFLAIGDWGWAVSNIAACIMNFISPDIVIDNWWLCVSMRSFYTFFAGSSLVWQSCIAYFLWRAICYRQHEVGRLWYLFHAIAWGSALIAVLVVALGGSKTMVVDKEVGMCFPKEPYHFIFWFAPAIVTFLWNVLFCGLVCWRIQYETRTGNVFVGKASHYRFMFYLLVYFICWPLNILNSVLSYIMGGCQIYVLVCLYVFLLNAQGGFDFLVYGFTNSAIRRRFLCRRKGWRKPLNTFLTLFLSPILVIPALVYYLLEVFVGDRLDSRLFGRGTKYRSLAVPPPHMRMPYAAVPGNVSTIATNYTTYGDTFADYDDDEDDDDENNDILTPP